MPTPTGADLIARILKQEGVDFMGVIPFNSLEEAAAKAGIRPLIFRQERVGVNLADAYTRVTNGNRTGVFSMQAGPGAENAFAGVAQAYADSVPILLLPASAPRSRAGVHPTFSPSRTYESVVKWAGRVELPEEIPNALRRAFSQLRLGRPSPVLLELPGDILRGDAPANPFPYAPVQPRRAAGDPQDIREAIRLLLAAKNPVIHAGQGVLYAEAWDELQELAELTQIPVMTSMAGKSAFREDHPLSLGTRSSTTTGMVAFFLDRADLVFGVGCSFTRMHYGADLLDSKAIVHITNDENDINKDYPADHAVIGDAKIVLRQILDEIKAMRAEKPALLAGRPKFAPQVAAVRDSWMRDWLPKMNSDATPINPYRALSDLSKAINPARAIMNHDSGSPRDQMIPFYRTVTPRGFIAWGKSTHLGYSLGAAMGAKLAAPDKLCVNVIGDYGFGMVGTDLETAVRENIPILTIVLNNSSMGIYRPEHFATAHELYGTKTTGGDFVKMAEALGGYSERVTQPQDIIPAINRCAAIVDNGQTALLEIVTDDAEKDMPYRMF